VGRSRAIELMATGRTISFEEALEMHLIDYIFDRDAFWQQILAYAQQFVPPNKASKAVGHIKRAVCTGMELPLAEGLALERELQQRLFDSSDAAEGLVAYVNKTVPRFNGR
jgi:enoyl-CoA hydratase